MLPKCAIQSDGSVLIDTTTPPPGVPLVGGIAVNVETGAVYATEDTSMVTIGAFDNDFDEGFTHG